MSEADRYMPPHVGAWVVERWRDGGALVQVIWRRRHVPLDAAEVPCRDCHVGEPHACPLLREELVVTYA